LLLYLFGASPAVCASFVAGRGHELERLSEDTFYLPHATSLRMGRLGYQSDAQSTLAVSYNNLESYAASLQEALTKPYPAYEAVGIRDGDDYRQLATSLLQIENEFYGTIRPKRVIQPGERALHALARSRCRVRRGATDGSRPVSRGRYHRGHDALSGYLPAALSVARQPA
jgi:glutamate--cysteine ligase